MDETTDVEGEVLAAAGRDEIHYEGPLEGLAGGGDLEEGFLDLVAAGQDRSTSS